VGRCGVVGSTLAFGSIGHGFESEHQGRSQAWAWGGLSPPNEKLAPQMKFSPCYTMGYYFVKFVD